MYVHCAHEVLGAIGPSTRRDRDRRHTINYASEAGDSWHMCPPGGRLRSNNSANDPDESRRFAMPKVCSWPETRSRLRLGPRVATTCRQIYEKHTRRAARARRGARDS